MPTPQELEEKFWKALESDKTVMLGLDGAEDGHTRPMTAQILDRRAPLWFFTSKDNHLAQTLGARHRAIATFTSKGHDIFATLQGDLSIEQDRSVLDKLWNTNVAAWYPGGKDDPSLVLLRLDADSAEIWEDAVSLVAGLKMMLGIDPKEDYKNKVARVPLG